MLGEAHLRSQSKAIEAYQAMADAKPELARHLYAEAAEQEEIALQEIPRDAKKTYSALALSLAALLYKSAKYDAAESACYKFLADNLIQGHYRGALRDLLDYVRDEQLLSQSGQEYLVPELGFSFKGGEVGFGTAPAEAILSQISGYHSIARRLAESQWGMDFRTAGPPSAKLDSRLSARISQPTSGSYRFRLRFAASQTSLLQAVDERFSTSEIPTKLFDVVRAAASGDIEAVKKLQLSELYRDALLKLVRNVIPDGKVLGSVELVEVKGFNDRAFSLNSSARSRVAEVIRHFSPPPTEDEIFLKGVLRAVHLDEQWLGLLSPDGANIRCKTGKNVLDDVVGPMVNRNVIAHVVRSRKKRDTLKLLDIELDDLVSDK